MKTVFKVLSRKGGNGLFKGIQNPFNVVPANGSFIVVNEECYTVSYTEYNFDEGVLYVISFSD